jgi:hypothetical protein
MAPEDDFEVGVEQAIPVTIGIDEVLILDPEALMAQYDQPILMKYTDKGLFVLGKSRAWVNVETDNKPAKATGAVSAIKPWKPDGKN